MNERWQFPMAIWRPCTATSGIARKLANSPKPRHATTGPSASEHLPAMPWPEAFYLTPFFAFTFVLARVSGLVITAPTFTGSYIPRQVRVFLAVGIALVLMPTQWNARLDAPTNLPDFAILMVGELLIGIVLGLGVAILMSGLQLAGQVIAQMSGMALADVLNPVSETELPVFSSMLYMVS